MEVAVVSIFGRGHWLASQMAEQGYKVCLLELSSGMGPWAPEDWEGPFGFLQTEDLEPSQVARIMADEAMESVPSGFCWLLGDGPVDTMGPLAAHSAKRRGFEGDVFDYIRRFASFDPDSLRKLRQRLSARPFAETWPVDFAHALAATQFKPNALAREISRPMPLLAPYFIRRASRRGFETSLDDCEKQGVRVFRQAKILDLQVVEGRLTSLEVRSDWSGELSAENFVWGLTSEETEFLGSRLSKPLYPRGVLRPEWCWVRFEIEIADTDLTRVLPPKMWLVDDVCLPWTHAQLIGLQRSAKSQQWDAWLRIPHAQRFKTDYLTRMGEGILDVLRRRWPGQEPRLHLMPQDYVYDSSRLGPTRWPVYADGALDKLKVRSLANLVFDSPETWQRLDWTGQFQSQVSVYREVTARVDRLRARLEKQRRQRPGPTSEASL